MSNAADLVEQPSSRRVDLKFPRRPPDKLLEVMAARVDTTDFVRALLARGHTLHFAEAVAAAVVRQAEVTTPSWPIMTAVALGSADYEVHADVRGGKLALLRVTRVVP